MDIKLDNQNKNHDQKTGNGLTPETMRKEIALLKQQENALIMAHNYQLPEIQDVADFVGDSLELARQASRTSNDLIVFCGVRFMAETAKILSPQKTVIMPVFDAGCPMADMASGRELAEMKKKYPDYTVVSYVNSTAEVKTLTDVCCTSSNAVEIVKNIENDKMIFVPDKNLGSWVKGHVSKDIVLWDGYCYVHDKFSADEVKAVREQMPEAVIMTHPECPPEVSELSDYVLSTAGMLDAARRMGDKTFVVGTEEGLLYRLQKENPDKTFFPLGSVKTCLNMKKTRLHDLYVSLREKSFEIQLPVDVIEEAKAGLDKMLEMS